MTPRQYSIFLDMSLLAGHDYKRASDIEILLNVAVKLRSLVGEAKK